MNKKTYTSTTLECLLQTLKEIGKESLYGVISRTRKGFKFEEVLREEPFRRNPKLFEGQYCSLTHKRNGNYKINMNEIAASEVIDSDEFVIKIYSELLNAIELIKL